MSGRALVLCVIALLLAVSSRTGFADPGRVTDPCRRVFADLRREVGDDAFWRRNLVVVTLPNGRTAPFAFGFDAELWNIADTIALVSRNAEIREHASNALNAPRTVNDGHSRFPTRKQSYTARELADRMGYPSVTEFREKALRAESKNKRTDLQLVDIKISALPRLKTMKKDKNYHGWTLLNSVNEALEETGYPVHAWREFDANAVWQGALGGGASIEIRQTGSTTSPAEFSDLIKNFLYKTFRNPETHFHVSVPTAAISSERMMLAARALETKIILEEAAANLKDEDPFYPYDNSALAANPLNSTPFVGRGAVRVTANRWNAPVPAHDIEIRQWLDADNGLSHIRFMIELVQKQERLRNTTTSFTTQYIPKLSPANLHSSLLYAAHVLENRLPAKKRIIAKGLKELGLEIQSSRKVSPQMREKVAKFLKENEVLTYINVETFLE